MFVRKLYCFHRMIPLLIFTFFVSLPVFAVSAVAMLCIALIELIVFGYLYTADRWFLNYVDWIFPMFLAWSTIYAVGKIVG